MMTMNLASSHVGPARERRRNKRVKARPRASSASKQRNEWGGLLGRRRSGVCPETRRYVGETPLHANIGKTTESRALPCKTTARRGTSSTTPVHRFLATVSEI